MTCAKEGNEMILGVPEIAEPNETTQGADTQVPIRESCVRKVMELQLGIQADPGTQGKSSPDGALERKLYGPADRVLAAIPIGVGIDDAHPDLEIGNQPSPRLHEVVAEQDRRAHHDTPSAPEDRCHR